MYKDNSGEKDNFKKEKDAIPVNVIKRLPLYHHYLSKLKSRKIERISSKKLAEKLDLSASQIRHDLNYFGKFGQSGYGYSVEKLYKEIEKIMGIDTVKHMVLIGAGNLGKALIQYSHFGKRGFYFDAVFDVDSELVGNEINNIPVLHIDRLEKYLKTNNIDIGVITTPEEAASNIAQKLVKGNVKGIWNFTPTTFDLKEEVIVENVHISESLFSLSCRMKEKFE